MSTDIDMILRLPVEARLEIMEKIWDSLEDNVDDTEAEISVAKERLAEYQESPEKSKDWNDVKNDLFAKYGLDNKD